MILLPHHPEFPHRRRILLTGIALGAVIAFCWPGLEFARRIAAPCAVILASAVIYGLVLGVLNALRRLPRMVFLVYGYAFFYGGLFGLVLSPFLIPSALADLGGSSEFERALFISSFIPLGLAAVAAAYVAIDAERNAAQQCVAADQPLRAKSTFTNEGDKHD